MDLKSKKEEDIYRSIELSKYKPPTTTIIASAHPKQMNEYDWDVVDEYDPLWPNDYEKLIKGNCTTNLVIFFLTFQVCFIHKRF